MLSYFSSRGCGHFLSLAERPTSVKERTYKGGFICVVMCFGFATRFAFVEHGDICCPETEKGRSQQPFSLQQQCLFI
jgi:hypothetical protein